MGWWYGYCFIGKIALLGFCLTTCTTSYDARGSMAAAQLAILLVKNIRRQSAPHVPTTGLTGVR
jgi:hypothetical protein